MATAPVPMLNGSELTKRQRILRRKNALFNERTGWMTDWQDISQYLQPRAGRFLVTDGNRSRRMNSIFDNTGTFASRTLAAGMMSGMTSPARPWFRLTLADRDLREVGRVKTWLHRTTLLLREVFAKSNTYRALHMGYEELGLFGVWGTVVLPDFDTVLHHYPLTIGQYALAQDHRGVVNTLIREEQMTVEQLVGNFGVENVSPSVKNMWDRHNLDAYVPIVHIIEPNKGRDTRYNDSKNMPFSSCYLESGNDNDNRLLRESGFKRFPALCPRWDVKGSDVYGGGPGTEALGDVRQLQHQQLRKSQGIDYQTNPPIQVPLAYKEAATARLPGGVMHVDVNNPGGGIRSAYDIQLNLSHLQADIEDVRQRIRSAFYTDLFMMLSNDTRSGVTATEVAERHEEKLLMLGPVLERQHNELLSPMIDLGFDYCAEAGILPEPPPELEGEEVNIDFVSTLAQAQRAVSSQGLDRLIGTVTTMSSIWPEVRLKVDALQAVADYAENYGANPEVIVPDDVVAERQAAEQQAAAAAQTAAAAPMAVDAAKTASEIDPQGLQDVMGMFQGYSTPASQ